MNILLLSNSAPNYFHFFNALSKLLERDGNNVFVAVDSEFSREQNELDHLNFPIFEFSHFFRNHEINAAILEKYSNYNLNSALLSDFERAQVYGLWGNVVGVEYLEKLKSALLSYYDMIFEKYQIDTVLYENVSNTFSHFALFVAQEKGARYFGIGASRLPGRFAISSDPLNDDATLKAFDNIYSGDLQVSEDVRKHVKKYIAGIETIVPDYMKLNKLDRVSLFERYFKIKYLKKIWALLKYLPVSRARNFQIGNPPLTHLKLFFRNVARRINTYRVKMVYQLSVEGEEYLLYPLHFHPESSTSILSGTYLNEYEVIRNIAFNLPQGIKLYVKDHVSAWGYPSYAFYKSIKQLPNVRLLAPTAPTKQLIKKSHGVITLTSTVGYEALLLHKPVFLYGRVFYEFHKGVQRIENPAKLFEQLSNCLDVHVQWDAKYNENFVCAYHAATLPGVLNLMQTERQATIAVNKLYPVLLQNLI